METYLQASTIGCQPTSVYINCSLPFPKIFQSDAWKNGRECYALVLMPLCLLKIPVLPNLIQGCSILYCQYIVDHFSINKSTIFFLPYNIIYCKIYWDHNILLSSPGNKLLNLKLSSYTYKFSNEKKLY